MNAIADSFSEEVNADGIRALSVCAGHTATRRTEELSRGERNAYPPNLPMKADDVAAMVVHALKLPRTAEVREINIRLLSKSY